MTSTRQRSTRDVNALLVRSAIVVAFNTLIAIALTATGRGRFMADLVFSQAIGLSVFGLIELGATLLWGHSRPPRVAYAAVCAVAVVLGFAGGGWVARALLGEFGTDSATLGSSGTFAVTLAASAAAVLYFGGRERMARLKLAVETEGRQAVEARLKLLQAQIEPHFLFNTLANLHALIGSDPPRAQRMLEHLNDYLRSTLTAARKPRATLAEEFALLRGYLEVLQVRMDSRLTWSLTLPSALERCELPPMLLQPLVENAIKHGLEPKLDGGRVEVTAATEAGRLELTVRDTGLGLRAGAATAGTGVGVEHVRARLAAAYGAEATLSLSDSAPFGVCATISLPLAGPTV